MKEGSFFGNGGSPGIMGFVIRWLGKSVSRKGAEIAKFLGNGDSWRIMNFVIGVSRVGEKGLESQIDAVFLNPYVSG